MNWHVHRPLVTRALLWGAAVLLAPTSPLRAAVVPVDDPALPQAARWSASENQLVVQHVVESLPHARGIRRLGAIKIGPFRDLTGERVATGTLRRELQSGLAQALPSVPIMLRGNAAMLLTGRIEMSTKRRGYRVDKVYTVWVHVETYERHARQIWSSHFSFVRTVSLPEGNIGSQ
jgi:hypothetical protein